MAFANLFTKLCEVQETLNNSCKADLSNRTELTNGKEGPSRKRKKQAEQTGTVVKKHCFQASTSCDVFSEVPYNHKDKAVNKRFTNNVKKQKKKNKGKKKQDTRYKYQNNLNKCGRGRNEDNKPPPKPSMTQEFIDQNAMEVNGRLICAHHLRGRCIKGDACQLDHIQGYNNLIKEACKFYIQGFCMKGDTCPYMHQSFPCKFFHKKGRCSRDDCKFSHDPLNDFTEKLLEDAIKRGNELLEQNQKDKQDPLGQNENVPAETEENIILQPVRPNFYQSSDTNVDEEASLSHTEQEAETTEEYTLHQTEDDFEADTLKPLTPNDPGPVCYSVEAVLGPQLYKPCFYAPQRSQESSLYVPKTTSNSSSNHTNAPYSVTNVLRSQSRLRTACYLPPITQTVPTTCILKEMVYRKGLDDKTKVSQLGNMMTNPDKFQEKFVKQPPSLNAVSVDRNKGFENKPLKPIASGTIMSSELKETKDRTNKSVLTNQNLYKTGEPVSTYFPPIGSPYLAKNCETSKPQVKTKLRNRDLKQTLKAKATVSTSISNNTSCYTNQASLIHSDLQKTDNGLSLNTQQSVSIKSFGENRHGSVLSSSLATSGDKITTGAFHGLFTALVPDSSQSSNVITSFTEKHAVPVSSSLQTSTTSERKPSRPKESTSQVSFSDNTNSKVPSKLHSCNLDCNKTSTRQHSLFASLHPDVANEPTIPSAQSPQKDQSVNMLQVCGPSKARKITANTVEMTTNNNEVGMDLVAKYSETSNIHNQKSSSLTPLSHKTSAKSFSSLFAAPLSKASATKDSAISISFQKTSQSSSVTTSEFSDTNQGRKTSPFTEQTTESKNIKDIGAHLVGSCNETSNKPCQKSFSSLFATSLSKTCPMNDSPISKKSFKSIDNTAHSIDHKINDNAGYNESNSGNNKKTEPCNGTEEKSKEQRKKTVSNTSSNSSNKTSTSQDPQHTTDLSHNGPTSSVLRSLFLSLSPYIDPHKSQTSVQPETKLDNIYRVCDLANQSKKKRKAKDEAASPSPLPKTTWKKNTPLDKLPTTLQIPDVPSTANRKSSPSCAPGTQVSPQTRTDSCEHQDTVRVSKTFSRHLIH